jgi:hypothetical protein
MTISIYNDADVVATANGSIDLTGLTLVGTGANVAAIEPDVAALLSGKSATSMSMGAFPGQSVGDLVVRRQPLRAQATGSCLLVFREQ